MEMGFSLGSNLGRCAEHLRSARLRLLAIDGAREIATSSMYETSPVGVQKKHEDVIFLNAVVVLDSVLPAEEWLGILTRIEKELGRERDPEDKNAPRVIDVDLLYAGDRCIDSGGLIVPHPRWAERRFVLEPLAEIRPDLVLPHQSRCVKDLLANLDADESADTLDASWL